MAVSQNGWPVNPPRRSRQVPGSEVRLTVADGPAGDVLMYVVSQFDRRVEDVDWKSTRGEYDDWGYANRNVRNSTQVSNHASATAVDVNATRHPLGARDTFTPPQVAEIHKILAEVDHVVRWGGDYTGRRDEMHFEIVGDQTAVARVAARLNQVEDDLQADERNALLSIYNALFKNNGGRVEHPTQGDQSIITRLVELQVNTRALLGRPAADVDEVALAKALAPLLPDMVGDLSDDDLARIATAVADENARRQAA